MTSINQNSKAMKTNKYKSLVLLVLFCTASFAQTKKLDKTFKTNKDVTVVVDSKYSDLQVEYWDKNEVQVEAVVTNAPSDQKQLQQILNSWNLTTKATAGEVVIHSSGNGHPGVDLAALEVPLAQLPELLEPLQKMMVPLLENIAQNPLPPKFYENMGNIHFDYEAYQKEGDKYLEKFEKQVESNFGEDFQKSMEQWAANFEKDSALWKGHAKVMEDWGEKFGKDMEKWGEEYGKEMEKWGEQFGKDMEKWGEQFGKEMEARYGDSDKKVIIINDKNSPKKLLKVKMPRSANLKLNVRYGDVNLAGTTRDLQGEVSHSKFTAGTIAGDKTNLKVSFTPVRVKNWDYGILNASYVQDLQIDRAESIKLTSNSSDVVVNQIGKTGIFRGTFGELSINKVDPGFQSLDIVLENSDLKLDLPEVAYNFTYSGTKSEVKYPDELNLKSSNSYDNQKLQGFNKDKNAKATVSISANFSDVLLK